MPCVGVGGGRGKHTCRSGLPTASGILSLQPAPVLARWALWHGGDKCGLPPVKPSVAPSCPGTQLWQQSPPNMNLSCCPGLDSHCHLSQGCPYLLFFASRKLFYPWRPSWVLTLPQSPCSAPFTIIHRGFSVPRQTLGFYPIALRASFLGYSLVKAPAPFISVLPMHSAVCLQPPQVLHGHFLLNE